VMLQTYASLLLNSLHGCESQSYVCSRRSWEIQLLLLMNIPEKSM